MNDIAMISDAFNIIITILIGALCAVTIIQPFVLTKTDASDRETRKRLLATAVEVEKHKMSWRARHRRSDNEF